LGAGGEFLALVNIDGITLVDSITFGPQSADTAYGRYPDGSGNWQFMNPTPGITNTEELRINDNKVIPDQYTLYQNYPNPFNPVTSISFTMPISANVKIAAYDIDKRKVGLPIAKAIFAEPNCTTVFQKLIPVNGVEVKMGPLLDGMASHMKEYPESQAFRVANVKPVNVVEELKNRGAEVMVCYLPVGSQKAVEFYANACLQAKVAMVNCMPVFIASDQKWANKFKEAGVPIIGDDIKSQIGATIVHRVLSRLFNDRGCKILRTYQLNTGGNTDFLNMLEKSRLKSKKISKTGSVQSQLDVPLGADNIHIGPSDYVSWQKDNMVAFIRIEGEGFGGAPINLEMRLSVQDSPNSAGVVIDAIRCAALARERGLAGPLNSASSYYMKTPPVQHRDHIARELTNEFIMGKN